MSERRDDDATPVGELPTEVAPPEGHEERLVGALRRRGLLRPRRERAWVPLAAALAGVVVGWLAHTRPAPSRPAASADEGLYLLLLSDDPPEGPSIPERVRLYSAWAGELAAEGRLEAAKKLTDEGVVVGPSRAAARPQDSAPDRPTGFFLLRAGSLDEAVELARESPHARLGGVVTVRPIDPV